MRFWDGGTVTDGAMTVGALVEVVKAWEEARFCRRDLDLVGRGTWWFAGAVAGRRV